MGYCLSTHFIASLSCVVYIENTSGLTKILAKRVRKGNTLMLLYLLFAVVGVREGVKNRRPSDLNPQQTTKWPGQNLTFDSKMLLLWILSHIGNHIIRLCTVDKYSRGK